MVIKEKLAALPMCYSITVMKYRGRSYCVCASEERNGKIVMVDTQTKEVSQLTGLVGGVMALIPVPEQEGVFLAIQKFYPVFASRKAEVVCCRISGVIRPVMEAEVRLVKQLPFVHRIALTGEPGKRRLIAATLCRDKKYTEDWSMPGAVYEYSLDSQLRAEGERVLKDGITQNHGMYTYEKRGGSYLLVSGKEGVWALDKQGGLSKLCGEEVSDLCMFDVDGDGMDEMICISPFHGDKLKILKKEEKGWVCMAEEEISFGHAVWSGSCEGEPLVLSCSRAGDRSIKLYHPLVEESGMRMEAMNIDENVGASNICVQEEKEAVVIYAANHGAGEVARYTIRW